MKRASTSPGPPPHKSNLVVRGIIPTSVSILNGQRRSVLSKEQLEFATYCIGNLSRRLGLTQPQTYRMLADSGVLEGYIVAGYDVLHTFGKEYLLDDLVDVLRERGYLA